MPQFLALIEIPLLDRKDKGRVLETCRWSQGAMILCGPSDSRKTTLVLQALDGRTNVIVVQLRQYENKLVDGFKEALGELVHRYLFLLQ
jgi:hypothetical protein